MKAISTNQSSLFFNTAASVNLLTNTWGNSFPTQSYRNEATTRRAASRLLRRSEVENSEWQEMAVRVVLAGAVLSAYGTAIWQMASF